MRVFFDTSAVVPAFLASHPEHRKGLLWLERVRNAEVQGVVALHTAAEAYRTLSTWPSEPRPDSEGLLAALGLLLDGPYEVVEPLRADYRTVVADLVARDIRGGVVYDALLVQAARRARADIIITFDTRDFRRLAPDLADRIRAP